MNSIFKKIFLKLVQITKVIVNPAPPVPSACLLRANDSVAEATESGPAQPQRICQLRHGQFPDLAGRPAIAHKV